jgi:hypothetical protein
MPQLAIERLCEEGSALLARTEYLAAESRLEEALQAALGAEDWDTVARVAMPLQETRRQRRQRCGEGTVWLDVCGPDAPDPASLVDQFPHGQFLIPGHGSTRPSVELRELAANRQLYVECFLSASYPIGDRQILLIVPTKDVQLPPPGTRTLDELIRLAPPHSIVQPQDELPRGAHPGTASTFSMVMGLWERLHKPFLAMAQSARNPRNRIRECLRTIDVDYACELAHQLLADAARRLRSG